MDAEKLNDALYEKMFAEQEQFRQELLGQTAEFALDHAYEYTIREDILMAMEFLTLPEKQAAALLESPSPLADIFKDFRDLETGHMDHVRECIEDRAESLLDAKREANKTRQGMEQTRLPQQRKPSIKEQLAAKPVPGDQPAKPKGREAR